jgi:hypothetical protein
MEIMPYTQLPRVGSGIPDEKFCLIYTTTDGKLKMIVFARWTNNPSL